MTDAAIGFSLIFLLLAVLVWAAWTGFALMNPTRADAWDHASRRRFRRELSWFHHHLVLALLMVAVAGIVVPPAAYQAGYTRATQYNASYFQKHFGTGLALPQLGTDAPVFPTTNAAGTTGTRGTTTAAGTSGTINLAYYPRIGNQGIDGSCAAFTAAWATSYEYNVTHGTHLTFTPRCGYDYYVCRYWTQTPSPCPDDGSNGVIDLTQVPEFGIPRYSQVPYGPHAAKHGLSAYGTEQEPTACYVKGTAFTLNLEFAEVSGYAPGGGMGLVQAMKDVIAGIGTADGKPHPVQAGFPVYPEYDNATFQPTIVPPQPGEADRGGHENAFLADDDLHQNPDGTVGAFLVQNQWTKRWGIAGRGWLSYSFVAQYVFGAFYEYIGAPSAHGTGGGPVGPITKATPPAPPQWKGNPAPGIAPQPHNPLLPPTTSATPPITGVTPGGEGWYVHGVLATANGSTIDITNLVNTEGDAYHVWPLAIVAVILNESALNVYAFRDTSPVDYSCGLMQEIVENVEQHTGITSPAAACTWEYSPQNSVSFGVQMLAECQASSGVAWPYLYVGYNAGCGIPTAEFYNPCAYNAIACQAENSFLANYDLALSRYAGGSAPNPNPNPAPKPAPTPSPVKTFPRAAWFHGCRGTCAPYERGGHLTRTAKAWQKRRHALGGVRGRGRYHPQTRHRKHGYEVTTFQHGHITVWPDFAHPRVEVAR